MRTTITIKGVGSRKAGISSKTQKPYDFTPVHFTYDSPYVTGEAAACSSIDAGTLHGYEPRVGDVFEAFVREDYRTGRVYVDGFII